VTRVKICGITCLEDAGAAVAAGADALGFIFAPGSPRRVEPATAARMAAALPPFVTTVGVFVNQPLEEILEVACRCRLQMIQLHGAEPPDLARRLPLPVIRAIRVKDETSLAATAAYPARAFLLDAFVEGREGGTGRTFPWALAVLAKPAGPIILSGGLTPENVGEAVRRVRPYAVDACSGVECRPGRKDPRKLEEFVAHVRTADLDAGSRTPLAG
jgi:phosphoribosylanthranilate isomerase